MTVKMLFEALPSYHIGLAITNKKRPPPGAALFANYGAELS
jgi:hypothetical protein